MYKLVGAIIANYIRMAAVTTADTDLRKGNGSPLVLARERDTSVSQIPDCSALTTYYSTRQRPSRRCMSACDLSEAFVIIRANGDKSVESRCHEKTCAGLFPARPQKPVWEGKQQFFSVPVKPCRKGSRDAFW